MKTQVEIKQPDWMDEGLESAIQTFRLARQGKLPSVLKGWMIETSCLRVLRSIHGDDLSTLQHLRDRIFERERVMASFEALGAAGEQETGKV